VIKLPTILPAANDIVTVVDPVITVSYAAEASEYPGDTHGSVTVVSAKLDGFDVTAQMKATTTSSWTYQPGSLAEGVHEFSIQSRDDAGNIHATPTLRFTVKAPPTPTPIVTATPLPTNENSEDGQGKPVEEQDVGLENDSGLQTATIVPQNPITETRKIEVNLPKNMILGESLEITLRFNPEDLDNGVATVSETNEPIIVTTDERERQVSAPAFSDIRHYEDYLLFATARLDAPGFKIASAEEERRLVRVGEEIVYRWSVQPVEAEDQTLIVALWLQYEPKVADRAPLADGMYWNASYKVKVRQTLFGITSSTLETYSTIFGGSGGVMSLVSGVGGLIPFRRRKEEEDESESLR